MNEHNIYVIYELTPAPWGDDYRYVQAFDRKEDAEYVLKALEKVNIDFSLYKIIEVPERWDLLKVCYSFGGIYF